MKINKTEIIQKWLDNLAIQIQAINNMTELTIKAIKQIQDSIDEIDDIGE